MGLIEIGSTVSIKTPELFRPLSLKPLGAAIRATVLNINLEHRWIRVEYSIDGIIHRETFKIFPFALMAYRVPPLDGGTPRISIEAEHQKGKYLYL